MGRALERSQQKRYRPKMNGSSRGPGGMQGTGAKSIGLDNDDGPGTRSVLELDDLSDFIGQAEMAKREFASERERFVVLDSTGMEYKPGMSSDGTQKKETTIKWSDEITDEQAAIGEAEAFRFRELSVPRRPEWDENTTADELWQMENESFLEWRRAIAQREEQIAALGGDETVTPFEKNLEVWRQLWRVLERSDCVVQIVDARNPMFYLSEDLRRYASTELGKPMLILVNKSDYLTAKQRRAWHEYLKERDIEHIFFSAFEEQGKLDEEARKARAEEAGRDARLEDQGDVDTLENNDADDSEDADANNNEANDADATTTTPAEPFGVNVPLTRAQLLDALPAFAARHKIVANVEHNGGKGSIWYGRIPQCR